MSELKKVVSFLDFINVELYTDSGYSVKYGMEYYIYSERHKEYQKYILHEGVKYDELKPYIEKGLVYVSKKDN